MITRTLISLLFLSLSANASEDDTIANSINIYLQSKTTNEEYCEPISHAMNNSTHGNNDEIILVWLMRGASYWQNYLTILRPAQGRYVEHSTRELEGEARSVKVKNGSILVEQVIYAKNDPLCCPSIKKSIKYKLNQGKIIEILK